MFSCEIDKVGGRHNVVAKLCLFTVNTSNDDDDMVSMDNNAQDGKTELCHLRQFLVSVSAGSVR